MRIVDLGYEFHPPYSITAGVIFIPEAYIQRVYVPFSRSNRNEINTSIDVTTTCARY